MGQILSTPVTEKHSESGSNEFYAYGLSDMQGWRVNMEDAHTTILDLNAIAKENDDDNDNDTNDNNTNNDTNSKPIAFFAVYDGHGGERIAQYSGENVYKVLVNEEAYKKGDYNQALKDAFLQTDVNILKDEALKDDQSGCTATTILIDETKIHCANAGDSRTVLSVNGDVKPLSFDHKPTNEGERARICAAGGFVDIGRVNGNLALSRAIGDFDFKKSSDLPPEEQIVTSFPDVIEHEIDYTKDEFVVLACDGIWDCLTSQQVVEVVRRGINERKSLVEISEALIDICLAPTSQGSGFGCDNMSVIIVALLGPNQSLDEWYDSIIAKKGPISPPFDQVNHEIYKNELNLQQIQSLSSNQSNLEQSDPEGDESLKTSFSIQQLLERNVLTSQNGVFYLDSSNLLNSLGVENNNDDSTNNTDEAESGEKISSTITEVDEDDDEEKKN